MNQKIIVESLSTDLLRIASGLHRGSIKMAEVFKKEALKRQHELETQNLDPYLKMLLDKSKVALASDSERTAEDLLMYSILFQNFARKYYS